MTVTGRSLRTARRLLQNVRLALGKLPGDFVTVAEFCAVYGTDESLFLEIMSD